MEQKSYLLITGASSGIGREIAVQLSDNYSIILNGRDKDRLKQVQSVCNPDKEHLIWDYDLAKVDTLEEVFTQFITENECTVTSFVHSAAYLKMTPIKMATVETFRSSFDVNVISAALITKVLMKNSVNMEALKSIVFISSNISNFGAKAFNAYAASKAAVDGLMRCLAVELAPTVRANSVLPGGVRTAMTEHLYQDAKLADRMNLAYPLGQGSVRDIAGAVRFLISEDARWITGQQLFVDGGRTINITG